MIKRNQMTHTLIVSAFPCTGKTYCHKNTIYKTLDSDSSKFDKKDFPENYIEHIKENIGKVDIIFVSSHLEVRDALCENGLFYVLVYPEEHLKIEYLKRMSQRGNDAKFMSFISDNWDTFLHQMQMENGCIRVELGKGEYILDVL